MQNPFIKNIFDKRDTNFYGGRSPREDLVYGFDSFGGGRIPTNTNTLGNALFRNRDGTTSVIPASNRSFSALTSGSTRSAINRPNTFVDPNMRVASPLMSGKNRPNTFVEPSIRVPTSMPQQRSSLSNKASTIGKGLLNFAQSPYGEGFATGLLKAGGFSPRPISFAEALGTAMEQGQKSRASAQSLEFEREKFNYEKEQDILNRALAYAQIKDVNVPQLQQNIRAMLEADGLKPGTPEYDKAFSTALSNYLNKTDSTKVTIEDKGESAGDIELNKLAASSYTDSTKELQKNRNTAIDQNINIETMLRLVNQMDDSDFGTFGLPKLQLKQFAKQLGLNEDDIDDAEVFFTLAGDFVMQQISKTKGAISNKEMAYFEMISPGLSRSKSGNILQLKLAKAVNDWHIELDKKRLAWRRENKDLDAISLDIGWQEELIRISEEENEVLKDFNKAIQSNIMDSAYKNYGKDKLVYDYSVEDDLNAIKGQIQTYYKKNANQIKDYQLVGYEEVTTPDQTTVIAPKVMVTLDDGDGNERYEIRTIAKKI
jgi:hypothetical protein